MEFDILPTTAHDASSQRIPLLRKWVLIAIAALIFLCASVLVIIIAPPKAFPSNELITIPTDASAAEFAHILKDAHIIRSETLFRGLARVSGFDTSLDPGVYVFQKPVSLVTVLFRTGKGQHGINPIRVTLTEGMTTYDMADTLAQQIPSFDRAAFLDAASTSEGYLFPDTYLFMPTDSAQDIATRLRAQFDDSIASITPQIASSTHSISDVVTMASILEREAKTPEDMRIVAGILWNRIDAGMALQVDAAFGYARHENGYTPTAADLASDSPYNTYRNVGLPPTPISNPGLDALLAAAVPTENDYFYYLTGKDGKMHYAKTFEEHKKNRALYLD